MLENLGFGGDKKRENMSYVERNRMDISEEKKVTIEELSDEDLLSHYETSQAWTRDDIERRDHPGEVRHKDVIGSELDKISTPEESQGRIEVGFTDLGKLRKEIERRGLRVPTMEEKGM
ncbi:hypothetical protein A3A95_02805 [Candidatus Nomurabacteria bacterium RIFCSPLOWO2_01_FULL_39_18]|uniref:Uncharacterized protein n=1 Tax=Candidatus Nomurabacteria bacterium RIFCSPHIGHO2_01_FULL_40_24b TaxID=1801739 RepID=A0A1F6V7T5_9BACT|nr:MAG: hypothetical protein A2647_03755 [Candidatus Nomurabacteria bacterium RIFCSPHIGHO2_01_FULL_40_24b]OGI89593.1 MAG: hypothetical protein A3A95_02805 [Candidatus Nomurabacteria bacterium RIFCSPLOWO2_01_FULL_39_18]